jgi:hypothetical protein
MPVHLTCPVCGAAFSVTPTTARRGRTHCSPACRQNGHPTAPTATYEDGSVGIPLFGLGGSVRAYAVVDAADAALANQWHWSLNGGYATRRLSRENGERLVRLHREILGLPRIYDGREGDHIDRDRLNCRRSNLRVIPKPANAQNRPSQRGSSSPYRGVSWNQRDGRWQARVESNGKMHSLGYFDDEQAAAEAARTARARFQPYATD